MLTQETVNKYRFKTKEEMEADGWIFDEYNITCDKPGFYSSFIRYIENHDGEELLEPHDCNIWGKPLSQLNWGPDIYKNPETIPDVNVDGFYYWSYFLIEVGDFLEPELFTLE